MTVWRGWGASADGSLPAGARQPPAVIAREKPRTAEAAVRATRWLDRLSGKSYSNKDPSVTYYYDQTSYNGLTISNGKGQRTGMSDGSGQTAWSYDTMGRIVAEQRTIAGVTKTMSYSYNRDGSLASVTYPSGRSLRKPSGD
jgi:YD repeat-containing protein